MFHVAVEPNALWLERMAAETTARSCQAKRDACDLRPHTNRQGNPGRLHGSATDLPAKNEAGSLVMIGAWTYSKSSKVDQLPLRFAAT